MSALDRALASLRLLTRSRVAAARSRSPRSAFPISPVGGGRQAPAQGSIQREAREPYRLLDRDPDGVGVVPREGLKQ